MSLCIAAWQAPTLIEMLQERGLFGGTTESEIEEALQPTSPRQKAGQTRGMIVITPDSAMNDSDQAILIERARASAPINFERTPADREDQTTAVVDAAEELSDILEGGD